MLEDKDLGLIKEHWENENTVSLRDKYLQLLERETIIEFIKHTKKRTLKDIGCGDGSDTIYFAKFMEQVFAYDYSDAMLKKASEVLKNSSNVILNKLNILEEDLDVCTDLVITKRMLINLGNFENQKAAIEKIYNSLEENGYYIMLETSSNGLKNLNKLRVKFNLEPIPEPFHNTLFDLDALKNFLEEYFIIEEVKYFSTYFFLTRVYNVLLNDDDIFKYDVVAKEITAQSINLFADEIIGAQFCYLLKKR